MEKLIHFKSEDDYDDYLRQFIDDDDELISLIQRTIDNEDGTFTIKLN